MNFNLYLDDNIAKELGEIALVLGKSRSGVIRQALREWLDRHKRGGAAWPPFILKWKGIPEFPPFESYRGE